jgi:prevent-host-death family protein
MLHSFQEVKTMINTISVRELRPNLSKIMENIHQKFDRYIVTKHGKPEIIMLSVEDYEGLIETLEIEADDELMKAIDEGEREIKEGKGVPLEKVYADLKKL